MNTIHNNATILNVKADYWCTIFFNRKYMYVLYYAVYIELHGVEENTGQQTAILMGDVLEWSSPLQDYQLPPQHWQGCSTSEGLIWSCHSSCSASVLAFRPSIH